MSAACSVFPDEAVLPAGAEGGTGNGEGGASPGGSGGSTAGGSSSTGGLGNGGVATGGVGANLAGDSGSSGSSGMNLGGADGGSAGEAGHGDAGGAAGSASTGGSNSGGMTSGGTQSGGAQSGGAGGNVASGGKGGSASCTPTILTFDATADTYLNEAASEQKSNFGSEAKLLVSGVVDARMHSLVSFDLSMLPSGREVVRATLRLVLVAPVTGARALSVYPIGRAWQEDKATWVRAKTGPAINWTVAGGDTALLPSDTRALSNAALKAQVDFDVRADVTPNPNYGWLLDLAPAEDTVQLASRESLFAEERPKLIVEVCP